MFNTKGQELKTGGTDKSFQPGVVYAHIYSASVKSSKNTGKKALEFVLEGPAIDNFEGWTIEKGDVNGPKFKGQSARVAATIWTQDFNDDNLNKNEILYKMTIICTELGLRNEMDNVKADSIEEWVEKVTNIVAGHNLFFFIKGVEEEYEGKTKIKLSLPKFKFAAVDDSKLDKFDKNNGFHYKALLNKPVSSFEPISDFEM